MPGAGSSSHVGEIAHRGKGLIAIFRGFFASTSKIFILAGGLRAGLPFYGV